MSQVISKPQTALLASPLPATQSWCVHVICLCKVGGYASAALFLAYLSVTISSLSGSNFLLPPLWMAMILDFMACYSVLSSKQAFAEYRWGQQVLRQINAPDSHPIPLSDSLCQFLWWMSLFRITTVADKHEVPAKGPREGPLAFIEASSLTQVEQLEEGTQQTPVPIQHLLISFFDTCAIFLQDASGKCVEIGQKLHSRRAALLSFLCFPDQKKGGIDRTSIIRTLYTHFTENTFDQDRPRILESINALAQESSFLPLSGIHQIIVSSKHSLWQAGALVKYDRRLMHLLPAWAKRIKEATVAGESLDRKMLRATCLYAMREYGDGFLAQPQLRDPLYWNWARGPFLEYRSSFLTLLEYAAELDIAASKQEEENKEECLRYAALYLECAMLTVLKVVPDRVRAEHFRQRCLKQYQLLKEEQPIERVNTMFEILVNQQKRQKRDDEL